MNPLPLNVFYYIGIGVDEVVKWLWGLFFPSGSNLQFLALRWIHITSCTCTLFKYFISEMIRTLGPSTSLIGWGPIVRMRWAFTWGHSWMIWFTVSSALHMLHLAGSTLGRFIRCPCVIRVCPILSRVRFTWVFLSAGQSNFPGTL